jgi:hypothetical protein
MWHWADVGMTLLINDLGSSGDTSTL